MQKLALSGHHHFLGGGGGILTEALLCSILCMAFFRNNDRTWVKEWNFIARRWKMFRVKVSESDVYGMAAAPVVQMK